MQVKLQPGQRKQPIWTVNAILSVDGNRWHKLPPFHFAGPNTLSDASDELRKRIDNTGDGIKIRLTSIHEGELNSIPDESAATGIGKVLFMNLMDKLAR